MFTAGRGFTPRMATSSSSVPPVRLRVRANVTFGLRILRRFGFTRLRPFVTRPEKAVGCSERWRQATRS